MLLAQNLPNYALQSKNEALFLAPIAWLFAKLLDLVLGKHEYLQESGSSLQFHRTGQELEPLRDEFDDEISILKIPRML